MNRHASIRDQLERDIRQRYPAFAHRQEARRESPRQTRALAWQDRALLILAAALVLLLIVRVETARASEANVQFWGIEAIGSTDAEVQTLALDTDIQAEITGLTARVEVTQHFRNGGAGWREAVYRYPLPPGAAVDRLRIEAGGRIIEGEIHEKEEAQRQYRQARRSGRLASLFEQQRPNQFETRLANIGPGEEIRVAISFLARVDYADGRFSLRLPMTFTPRWDAPAGADMARSHDAPRPALVTGDDFGDHHLSIDIMLHVGMPLSRLASRYHDIDITPVAGGYRVSVTHPGTLGDRVFELDWEPAFGAGPQASVTTWDGGDAVYALLMLAPPLAGSLAPQPREVVFVIDTSGSMAGNSIRQARAALARGLGFLGPDDSFNLVRFDSDAELLFEESVPAQAAFLEHAAAFIAGLEADGGTNMRPALDLAMGLPRQSGLLRQIVFVTDGSVGNEVELLQQIGEQLGDSRLFTVSIGSAPNEWFMRKAAIIGRGSHQSIAAPGEVDERMVALWAQIEHPALQNVCVDWGMEAEYYPEVLPDLYAGEPLWLYARLPFEPREVTVCGELGGVPWESTARLSPAPGNPDLAALWARGRIEALEDSRLYGFDPASLRQEVVDLALRYGLLTVYTSLVAVDHTPVRPASDELRTEEVPSLLPAGSALTSGFAQTATGWPLQLALSFLALLLAAGMLLYLPPSRAQQPGGSRRPEAAGSP